MESYDAFMIGLPEEMKGFEKSTPKYNINSDKPIGHPAKRKRTDDAIIADRLAKSSASRFSNIIPKIGSEIRVEKVISRITEATTVSAQSNFNSLDSDDVILVPDEEAPKSNTAKDLKKNYDAARRSTDFIMHLTDNRISSPNNTDRRMTITSPIVLIPKNQLSKPKPAELNALPNSDDKAKENRKNSVNKTETKTIRNYGRNSCNSKVTTSNQTGKHVDKSKEAQLSVTLPTSGNMMTRSRISLGNGAKARDTIKCDLCEYTTDRKSNLTRHIRIHSVEKPFKCKHCQNEFSQKIILISHLRRNHSELHSDPDYWEFN